MNGIDLRQISAEVEAEAGKRRRQDRELVQLELDIEKAWADISASSASALAVGDDGSLLDQASVLAALDPQVPIGSRRGLRSVKWLIRRLSYWYVRFLTDQFNVFAGVLVRHLRNVEGRLSRLEDAAGLPTSSSVPAGFGVLDSPAEPSAAAVDHVTGHVGTGPCLVLSAGAGAIVEAVANRGIPVHGVEQDPDRALVGLSRRVDIRSGDFLAYLFGSDDGEFGTIVLTGKVETLPLKDLLGMADQASRKLMKTGRIIVAVADPATRGKVDSELGSGLGISPVTWRHLLERIGFDARLEPCPDSRITEIVVAQRTDGLNQP